MHSMDARIARRLGQLLKCDVTLSENHPGDKITLCGFDDVLEEILPIVRKEAAGWYVRTPTYG
jgi:hypothetical protein